MFQNIIWAIFFHELTNERDRERSRIPGRRKAETSRCEQVRCEVCWAHLGLCLSLSLAIGISVLPQLFQPCPAALAGLCLSWRACDERASSCCNQNVGRTVGG